MALIGHDDRDLLSIIASQRRLPAREGSTGRGLLLHHHLPANLAGFVHVREGRRGGGDAGEAEG
jgi:hypothetical protein